MGEHDGKLARGRNYPAIEEDYAAWLQAQIALLRDRRFAELDVEHLADEVGDLGISEYKSFESAIFLVLFHMLKWDYQIERRSRSWRTTINTQRGAIIRGLKQSPSLKARKLEALEDSYQDARLKQETQTGVPAERLPDTCPYSWDDLMTRLHDFDPDRPWPN